MQTILLVEDSVTRLNAYRRGLEACFMVLNAKDTEEADAQLRAHPEISIVVLTGENLLKSDYAERIRPTFPGTLVGTAANAAAQSRLSKAFNFIGSPSTVVEGLLERFGGA